MHKFAPDTSESAALISVLSLCFLSRSVPFKSPFVLWLRPALLHKFAPHLSFLPPQSPQQVTRLVPTVAQRSLNALSNHEWSSVRPVRRSVSAGGALLPGGQADSIRFSSRRIDAFLRVFLRALDGKVAVARVPSAGRPA